MLRHTAIAMCAMAALAICDAAADSSQRVGNAVQLESAALEGACSAREDFSKIIADTRGDPEEASYLRDIGNYRVRIATVDDEQVSVSFTPVPRSEDEIATGGSGMYLIDRRTGAIKKVTLDE